MEKVEVSKTLLAMADALAGQVESERKNGFVILIDEDDGTRVRECCTFKNLLNFTGTLVERVAERLKGVGFPKAMIEGALKDFVEKAMMNAFEEGEDDET